MELEQTLNDKFKRMAGYDSETQTVDFVSWDTHAYAGHFLTKKVVGRFPSGLSNYPISGTLLPHHFTSLIISESFLLPLHILGMKYF